MITIGMTMIKDSKPIRKNKFLMVLRELLKVLKLTMLIMLIWLLILFNILTWELSLEENGAAAISGDEFSNIMWLSVTSMVFSSGLLTSVWKAVLWKDSEILYTKLNPANTYIHTCKLNPLISLSWAELGQAQPTLNFLHLFASKFI